MALIVCFECNNEYSEHSAACTKCGCPKKVNDVLEISTEAINEKYSWPKIIIGYLFLNILAIAAMMLMSDHNTSSSTMSIIMLILTFPVWFSKKLTAGKKVYMWMMYLSINGFFNQTLLKQYLNSLF